MEKAVLRDRWETDWERGGGGSMGQDGQQEER